MTFYAHWRDVPATAWRRPNFSPAAAVPVYVRPSSSYHEHLVALNAARAEAGTPPIPIIAADEALEDYDLVELVDVGVIPAVILDSRLDQSERSAAGAIGIMQLMPATARDPNVGIPDIEVGRAQRRGRCQVPAAFAQRVLR